MPKSSIFTCVSAGVLLAVGGIVLNTYGFPAWAGAEQIDPAAPRAASVVLECRAEARPISPLIYGLAGQAEYLECRRHRAAARRQSNQPV